jgi:ketosteroid isomerase-like protein
MQPIEIVQDMYAAFQRRDIEAIMNHLADDVQWESWAANSSQAAGVPWMTARQGKEDVMEFFRIVGEFTFHEFSVLNLMAGEHHVSTELVVDATVPGGGRFRDEEMHLFTFNAEGKVTRLRHYTDTAKHIAAARGEQA